MSEDGQGAPETLGDIYGALRMARNDQGHPGTRIKPRRCPRMARDKRGPREHPGTVTEHQKLPGPPEEGQRGAGTHGDTFPASP